MWVRWAEQANASVDGENATVEIGDGTLLFPGGAALVVRLREVLHEPQPFAVLERELSDSAPAARVSQTLHALLNAQALTPWDVGRDLTLLHQQTVRGGEGSVLSPALETGRLLRDATGPATLLPYAESTGISLEQALRARRTCRSFRRCAASLEQLGSVLDLAAMPSPDRAPAPKSAGAPKVGQKVPDFTLADSSGRSVSLSELLSTPMENSSRPKTVLLVFYRGYW